jgi:uncharacterized protein (TIGR02118 family)
MVNWVKLYKKKGEGVNNMIKTIALAYRKQGMTRAEYNKYWLEKHAPLAASKIPNVRKYVQNHFLEIPGQEMEGDGIVEMWYDDVKSWQESRDSLMKMPELMKDGMNFARMAPGNFFWVVEEHVVLDKMGKK